MVRDEEGKFKDDLPRPAAKDDRDGRCRRRGVEAVEEAGAGGGQGAGRTAGAGDGHRPALEPGRLRGAAGPPSAHDPPGALLLWGGYDETGKLVSTFRVTEERDYADVNESTHRLEGLARVGVVHPLHLSDSQRSAWGQIFGDYEIIPPFPQLDARSTGSIPRR